MSKQRTKIKAIGNLIEVTIKKFRPAPKSTKKNRERKRSKR